MELGRMEILCGVIAILFILLRYVFTPSNFWKSRGVKGPKPIPLFGNLKDVMLLKKSLGQYLKELHVEYADEPLVGFYARGKPMLLVRDPDLIKDVLIKDFSTFSDRGIKIHEKVEPLSQHLVGLEAARWRPLRNKLSPTFTSGKLKEMFYILIECGQHFERFIEKLASKNEPVEIRELTAKYTTDVIGSCAFGLKMNAISDEDSEFRNMGRKVFQMDWWKIIKFRIRDSFPWLYDLLAPIFYDAETTNFFVNCMKETIEHREKNNIRRHDFVDLLRDIRDHPDKVGDIEMTDNLIAAQGFVFFVAGFETSSMTMSNALYELAQHHSIQDKLRQEINEELKKNNGILKYESIKNMKYLHKVFQETLRKHPPGSVLIRKAAQSYTFSGTNVTIPKDQAIFISTFGIHRDPKIYPDPDTFDPERFSDDIVQTRHPMNFLPFGDGPRNCIGARFAIYQTKVGLIKILQNYKVDVCEKTEIPYTYDPVSILLAPRNGIYLKFIRVN